MFLASTHSAHSTKVTGISSLPRPRRVLLRETIFSLVSNAFSNERTAILDVVVVDRSSSLAILFHDSSKRMPSRDEKIAKPRRKLVSRSATKRIARLPALY